jgi:hypothetical protein
MTTLPQLLKKILLVSGVPAVPGTLVGLHLYSEASHALALAGAASKPMAALSFLVGFAACQVAYSVLAASPVAVLAHLRRSRNQSETDAERYAFAIAVCLVQAVFGWLLFFSYLEITSG